MALYCAALPKRHLRDLKKGKCKCWGTKQNIAVLLRYLQHAILWSSEPQERGKQKGKVEAAAAAAVRGKEPFLEKGEQKRERWQKSVEAMVGQRRQKGSAAFWSCGVDRDHVPVRWGKVVIPYPALQW